MEGFSSKPCLITIEQHLEITLNGALLRWTFSSLHGGFSIATFDYLRVRFLKMALVHWIIRGVSIHALSSDPKIILGSMQFTGGISIHPMFYPHVPYSFFGFRRLESCYNQIPHQGP